MEFLDIIDTYKLRFIHRKTIVKEFESLIEIILINNFASIRAVEEFESVIETTVTNNCYC